MSRGWRRRECARDREHESRRSRVWPDNAPAVCPALRRRARSWREVQRGLEAGRRMRAHRELLQHAAAVMGATVGLAANDVAQRLDVQMMRLPYVDVFQDDVLALDREFAMIQPMRPLRVAVAEPEHEEIVDRREPRLQLFRAFAERQRR